MKMKRMIRVDILAIVLLACSLVLMSAQQQGSSKEYEYANLFVNDNPLGPAFQIATFNKNAQSVIGTKKYMNFDALFKKLGDAGWEYIGPLEQLDGTPGLVFMREKP